MRVLHSCSGIGHKIVYCRVERVSRVESTGAVLMTLWDWFNDRAEVEQ